MSGTLQSKIQNPKSKIALLTLLTVGLLVSPASGQDTLDTTQIEPIAQRPVFVLLDSVQNPQSAIRNPQSLSDSLSPSSPWKAAVLSLAVPGLGEGYAGRWDRARLFFITEAAVWTGFTVFRVFSHWRATDYRVYAAEHAGIRPDGKSDAYFRTVGSYPNSTAYNEQQQITQRDRARLYTDDAAWEWDNEAARKVYLSIRRSSERARVRSVYIVGVALVNRLVSAVDAMKAVEARNRKADQSLGFDLIVPPDGSVWVVARFTR